MPTESTTTFAILTSGGDAPGMNTAIAYLNRFAGEKGWRTVGIKEGFQGLLERQTVTLAPNETWKRARHGGTILGSSRLPDFANHVDDLKKGLEELRITKLAILGGNGSMFAASMLALKDCAVVGVPATIDNDIEGSDESIGFNTAVDTGVRMLDGIRDAAEAMPHVFALEVLGGGRGYLAQAVAEAGGVDIVILPHLNLTEVDIVEEIKQAVSARRYAIIVTPEYYPDIEGIIERVSAAVGEAPRFGRIGHAQRGGVPNARDRTLASAFSKLAIEQLELGQSGCVVWRKSESQFLPFDDNASLTRNTL